MAYIPPPQMPQGPNGWQIFGTALQQGGQAVDQFAQAQQAEAEKKNRLQLLMEDAALKRQQAEMARIKAEREAAEEARKVAESERAAEALRASKETRSTIKAGKTVPGKAVNGMPPTQDDVVPYSQEEVNRMLLESGDLSGKEFAASMTPPDEEWETLQTDKGIVQVNKKTGVKRDLGIKPPAKSESDPKWQVVQTDKGIVQLNPSTGEVRETGLKPPPKMSPKASENVKSKLQSISLAKQQIAKIQRSFDALKKTFSAGPGGNKLPTKVGKLFDADVDSFRQTLRSLTRTPGEGAMSDYESRLANASTPDRGQYEEVTQRQIDNLNDMVTLLENGYTGMQKEFETESPAPKATKSRDYGKEYGF